MPVLQQVIPVTSTFWQQVIPYILSFIAVVLPALGAYIVALLKANHKENVVANTSLAAKADTIVTQTNGVNEKLQNHIDNQTVALAASKDAQIAMLKGQVDTLTGAVSASAPGTLPANK